MFKIRFLGHTIILQLSICLIVSVILLVYVLLVNKNIGCAPCDLMVFTCEVLSDISVSKHWLPTLFYLELPRCIIHFVWNKCFFNVEQTFKRQSVSCIVSLHWTVPHYSCLFSCYLEPAGIVFHSWYIYYLCWNPRFNQCLLTFWLLKLSYCFTRSSMITH